MATLTDEQLRFLRSQNIPLSAMFDATGMKAADFRLAMKGEDKTFAYGVTALRRVARVGIHCERAITTAFNATTPGSRSCFVRMPALTFTSPLQQRDD